MLHNNLAIKRLQTGAAAGAGAASPVLMMPLDSKTWASPYTTYSFNADAKKRGLFNGTNGATFYSPESGTITPLPDGGFVISVSGSDNDREWIGGYIDGIDKSFAKGEAVRAGQVLGKLSRDLILVLKVSRKDNPKDYQFVDPVDVLQRYGAKFQDIEGQARSVSSIVPVPSANGAAQPSTELAMSSPAGVPSPESAIDIFKSSPKPQFTAVHLAAAVVGGTVLGFLITRAFRRGR